MDEPTMAEIAIQAFCDELSSGTDSMNVASDLEDYERRCIAAAAKAVVEACAKIADASNEYSVAAAIREHNEMPEIAS